MAALNVVKIQEPTQAKIIHIKPVQTKTGRVYNNPLRHAHAADPIKDADTMRKVRSGLAQSGKYAKRNLAIFDLGTASGRRCGDILNLRMVEVWDDIRGTVKEWVEYVDHKTSKAGRNRWLKFKLRETSRASLLEYLESVGAVHNGVRIWDLSHPLFPSRKGDENGNHVLSVRSYDKILSTVKAKCGIDGIEHLSSHTMRKTFGYNGFRQGNAEFVRGAFGHSSLAVTEHYLGKDAEYLSAGYDNMVIPGIDD